MAFLRVDRCVNIHANQEPLKRDTFRIRKFGRERGLCCNTNEEYPAASSNFGRYFSRLPYLRLKNLKMGEGGNSPVERDWRENFIILDFTGVGTKEGRGTVNVLIPNYIRL